MMKSFVRWSTTLGLVGSSLLGFSSIGNLSAVALPDAQIVEKLQTVPVYTITDQQGAPLVAAAKNGQNNNGSVAGVFISQQDARNFIEQLKKENAQLAQTVRVVPVSLGEVYKLEQANQNKPQGLGFAFVPVQRQVDSALTLLRQGGQTIQQFNGVPLFVATAGKDEGYLTLQQGTQQVIPFFFDKEQLQGMVDRFKQQKPDMASTVKIKVVNLQGVIQALRSSNTPQMNNIVLVPSQESLAFLQSLPAAPTSKPPSPAPAQRTTPRR
jgi:nickel transport protein